jgi:hypothetical protein
VYELRDAADDPHSRNANFGLIKRSGEEKGRVPALQEGRGRAREPSAGPHAGAVPHRPVTGISA